MQFEQVLEANVRHGSLLKADISGQSERSDEGDAFYRVVFCIARVVGVNPRQLLSFAW